MQFSWALPVVALLAWAIFVQVGGRRHLVLELPTSETAAAQVVASCFNVTWTQVTGGGDLNYRPKLRAGPLTISISFVPDGSSRCGIEIWTSRYTTQYGIMGHAQPAWRKKRKVAMELTRSLDAATN